MARFSGADEVVVRDLRRIEDRLEAAGDLADVQAARTTGNRGGRLRLAAFGDSIVLPAPRICSPRRLVTVT